MYLKKRSQTVERSGPANRCPTHQTYREQLAPYVVDAVAMMQDAQQKDMNILIEGANALMLDIDYGTYPYVTSSNTGIGGVFTGLALNPFKIKEIIGVVKAYTTRVGGGPFPSEQLNVRTSPLPIPPSHPPPNPLSPPSNTDTPQQNGTTLQTLGHEYGVTTGRPRRCGWLDLVVLKYSHAINHYTCLNLTKLDILDTFASIPVAVAYTLDGRLLDSFPADLESLERCEVVYETLPGWERATTGVSSWGELPEKARGFVEFVEERVGVRVRLVGTGAGRESMIVRD